MAGTELYTTSLFSDANLLNYYRLEGNSTDSKGSDNGTDTAITYGTLYGKFEQGASYNGSTSVITLPSEAYIDTLSISLWVKPSAIGAAQKLFGHKISNEVDKYFYFNETGYLFWGTGSVIYQNKVTTATSRPLTADWHHVVITQGSLTDVKIYMDNVACTTSQVGTDVAFPSGSATRVIGQTDFTGYIDDFAYFNKVLTTAEINSLYLSATTNYLSDYRGRGMG